MRIAEHLAAIAGLTVLALVTDPGGGPTRALAQDEVRIDIEADAARKIGLLLEGFVAAGDRAAARQAAVQADPILANDLELSTLFAVSKAWEPAGKLAFDAQAVVSGKLTVKGTSVTLSGEIKDFPARRLIARSEYRGTLAELRTLVHRFADDVAFHLTGEAGIAQTKIAYVSKGKGTAELYVVDVDGYGPRPLTAFKAPITSPTWAPDGREVLFSSVRGSGWNLYGVPMRGGSSRQITRVGTLNHAPAYAPDGRAIAFSSNKDGNTEIYVAGTDGSGMRRLTSHRGIDTAPAWAPNGQRIAFTSDRAGSAQVYVMDRDGGNQRRLIHGFSYSDSPDWSPRGDRIAFVVRTGSGFDIYIAGAEGENARPLITGGSNENPHWSPDGRQIVFSSNRGGSRGIWVTDLRGQSPRRLNLPGGAAANPAWSKRPQGGSPARTPSGSTANTNEGR
ncbi:MAG: hypothetical protein ACREOU_03435 [Candidatus Eiseniibacteriota bacterium]